MDFNPFLLEKKEYPLYVYAQKAAAMKAAGVDVINLTIGDPLDATYPPVYEALQSAVSSRKNSQYPKAAGSDAFRQSVAGWAKRNYGIELDPAKEIISCNGTKEAVFHLPLLFDWTTGKEMFFASMSYPVYASSCSVLGITKRELPLTEEGGFLPDLDAISDEDWQKCQVFWINSPHNPTTAIAPKDYFTKLLALAEKHDFLVCSDECYNEICYVDQPVSALDFPDSKHWLVFRSLSKRSHMTGLRSGALITKNQELLAHLSRLRNPMGVGSPDVIQEASIAAWNDDEHCREFSVAYQEKRDILRSALEAKGFKVFGADAGFYLWFSHPKFAKSVEILDLFIEEGIVITPGTAFGDDGEGYARMVYCETLEVCKKAAERIAKINI